MYLYTKTVWLLGNLARASYVGSSDFMWPYSYNKCTSIIRSSQEINACAKVSHYGLEEGRGRGAPEIVLLETMQGTSEPLPHTPIKRPYLSCSYQVRVKFVFDLSVVHNHPSLTWSSILTGVAWD